MLAALATQPQVVAVVSHGAAAAADVPLLAHVPGRVRPRSDSNGTLLSLDNCTVYEYPTDSVYFVIPSAGPKAYSPVDAGIAHSRSLQFLLDQLGGPYFDLETIWEEHTRFEFSDRSVAKTMATMVVSVAGG